MIKRFKKVIIYVLMLCVMFSGGKAYAYTQEEKDAAKQWLSSHGYSPDYAGALQAYEDYMSGKFGKIDGLPDPTTEATTEASTELAPQDTTGIAMEYTDTEAVTEDGTYTSGTGEAVATTEATAPQSTEDIMNFVAAIVDGEGTGANTEEELSEEDRKKAEEEARKQEEERVARQAQKLEKLRQEEEADKAKQQKENRRKSIVLICVAALLVMLGAISLIISKKKQNK